MIIINVGMDVHTSSYSLCCYNKSTEEFFGEIKIEPDAKLVQKYLQEIEKQLVNESETGEIKEIKFVCGYEAGCLGFSLYKSLTKLGIECKIIAPTTLAKEPNSNAKKTDRKDAKMLARNLAFGTCKFVHIPTEEDLKTRKYLRMVQDHKLALKKVKQQILAFCLSGGFYYSGKVYWTKLHREFLNSLVLDKIEKIIIDEYLDTYDKLIDKIERLEEEVYKISDNSYYKERTDKLSCLKGITKQSSLLIISEIGDFSRFATPGELSSYLGLVPGENSSGEKVNRLGITKQGNSIVRTQLIESSQAICKGSKYFKSKRLKERQKNQDVKIISYADNAVERLMYKYKSLKNRLVPHNKAIAAVARELSTFIWGIMNENLTITHRYKDKKSN